MTIKHGRTVLKDLKARGFRARPAESGIGRSMFGAACLTIQPLLLNALSLPAMAFIIRRLGESNYGAWMAALTLVAACSFVTNLGLRSRFVRSLARDRSSVSSLLSQQLGTRLVLMLLGACLAIAASIALRYPIVVTECVAIGALGMSLTVAATTAGDIMQAFERLPSLATANLAGGLILTGASVLVIWRGGGPVALSLAYVLGPFTSMILLFMMLRREGIRIRIDPSVPRAAHLLWDCRYLGAHQMLTAANANAASLMLPKLIGLGPFGLFAAGYLLLDRLTVVPDAIATALYPVVARLSGRQSDRAAHRAIWGLILAAAVCLLVSLVVSFAGPWIAHILFPRKFANCEMVIRITIWALPLVGIEYAMSYSLIAVGREASQARATLYGIICGLALGVILIVKWGLPGACWFVVARPAVQICFRFTDFFRTFVVHRPERAGDAEGVTAAADDRPSRDARLAATQFSIPLVSATIKPS